MWYLLTLLRINLQHLFIYCFLIIILLLLILIIPQPAAVDTVAGTAVVAPASVLAVWDTHPCPSSSHVLVALRTFSILHQCRSAIGVVGIVFNYLFYYN